MTRYPKGGKGRSWSVEELKAIPVAWEGDRLSDGGGLSGIVRVSSVQNVSVRFQYIYKWEGKISWFQCGTWPTHSLEAIRENRDKARASIKAGVNPKVQKRVERIQAQAHCQAVIEERERELAQRPTFSEMFQHWLSEGVARADGNAELVRSFRKDILPAIGSKPVELITAQDLDKVLAAVGRESGRGRTAQVLLNSLRQLFRWADRTQRWRSLMREGNPAEPLDAGQVVAKDHRNEPRDRTLTTLELVELRDKLRAIESEYRAAKDRRSAPRPIVQETQIALWLSVSTLCGVNELFKAKWQHVRLDSGEWIIPDSGATIYLSPFALRQFKTLQGLTGDTPWCFPARNTEKDTHVSPNSLTKQVTDRQASLKGATTPLKHRRMDDTLVLSRGVHGRWTLSDLRRTGAMIMLELGVKPCVIDRCQNLAPKGSNTGPSGQPYDFEEQAKAAWVLLGDRLESIFERPA